MAHTTTGWRRAHVHDPRWWKVIRSKVMYSSALSPPILASLDQARDLTVTALVLFLTIQSAGFMYRTQSLKQELPTRNLLWIASCVLLLVLQALYLVFRGLSRESLHMLAHVEWDTWVVITVMPWLGLLLGEYVKRQDKRIYDRFVQFLRLEFNTRLGTHSPR